MIDLRTCKGTIDYNTKESKIFESIINTTIKIFKQHGASPIDTPTFELRNILLNKYGEDSKLIYDLADQGGDIASLRYDLTVSFARFLAMNRISKIRRYQIGKVFRRDQPAVTRGRLREFTQCDFDIAGKYMPMTADAEILKIVISCLDAYNLGPSCIRINHRGLLAAIFKYSGVDSSLFATACSTLDKADKLSWSSLKEEFITKGLTEFQINEIEKYIKIEGDALEIIKTMPVAALCEKEIKELDLLYKYLKIYNIHTRVNLDFSLARGLDYYTGLIFEAKYINHSDVGSVCGGGRYDNLVDDLIVASGGKALDVPCVGFSMGLARIYSLINKDNVKDNDILVFVGSSGGLFLEERMSILNLLWAGGIPSITYYTSRSNFGDQMKACKKQMIDVMVIVGENELREESVHVLVNDEKSIVKINKLVDFINKLNII
ncbi:putative histidine--tRNA ligase, cytoplasmic [Astathelohania contejeani]|uniref:histidine--tRNA ligase n=1 Tax=Astathelohania contejeani TaxID=164912 RepID=A0ABQ7HZH5_9MICR|nr:putative histidine--tRNA ligase, cytoplasmic [Thelohania contejeani]